jgi:hypothetical protein
MCPLIVNYFCDNKKRIPTTGDKADEGSSRLNLFPYYGLSITDIIFSIYFFSDKWFTSKNIF